jgi:hypothetical protein
MILAHKVYDTCLALAKKDQRGSGFNIEEYNNVAALVNMELYNFYVSKYESGMAVTDALLHLKTRNTALTLTSGQAWLPSTADRLAGNPWVAHPWGVVTATSEVDVVNWSDSKVKVTSADHGLKDGAVVTVTGLSIHTITAKAIHYIDKNSFWVDVNYAAPDVLTSAAWTVVGASYKEVDMLTEEELSVRWADHLTKPTIQNPVCVLDMADKTGSIGTWAGGGYIGSISSFFNATGITSTSTNKVGIDFDDEHGLSTGDLIYIHDGRDGNTGLPETAYNGTHRVIVIDDEMVWLPDLTYTGDPTFALYTVYYRKRINVYPITIPIVNINYLAFPLTPFLDWYTNDTTYTITYLAEGETLTNQAAGYTYRDGTATNGVLDFVSLTQDWEWDDDLLPQIVYMILQKMGINLENMNVAQIATQLDVKEQSQV